MLERLTCRLGNVDDPRPGGLLRIDGFEVEVARVERALGVLIREVLGAGLRELTPFEKARRAASRSDGAMLVVGADFAPTVASRGWCNSDTGRGSCWGR
jgi:hypothetical protein